MSRYPGAAWRPLPRTSFYPGRRTAQLGLILHVQQGDGSPFGWFCNPASKASSTFWVAKDGRVEQYMEAGFDASWAQAGGNFTYDSVETEGYVTEALTDAQVRALAALCAWEHTAFGMPMVAAETPGARGLGWHGMGGSVWGGHYGCPGNIRKAQRAQVLGVATVSNGTTTGGAVPTAPGDLNATAPEDDMSWDTKIENGDRNSDGTPVEQPAWTLLKDVRVMTGQLLAAVAGVPQEVWAKGIDGGSSAEARLAAIQTLTGYAVTEATKAAAAAGQPVDMDALSAAIRSGLGDDIAKALGRKLTAD